MNKLERNTYIYFRENALYCTSMTKQNKNKRRNFHRNFEEHKTKISSVNMFRKGVRGRQTERERKSIRIIPPYTLIHKMWISCEMEMILCNNNKIKIKKRCNEYTKIHIYIYIHKKKTLNDIGVKEYIYYSTLLWNGVEQKQTHPYWLIFVLRNN